MFRKRRIFNIEFIFESNFTKFYNHFMIINHEFFTFEQYFDFTIFFETQKILYSFQQHISILRYFANVVSLLIKRHLNLITIQMQKIFVIIS